MKKSFILAAILFLVCFVVAGCNSDNYEYLELEASSVPINENGGLNEVSKLGVTLSAPENTFDSNEGIKIRMLVEASEFGVQRYEKMLK